jgi:2-polyprenyl-6-methoxyphenol hydroxylase-like FAD-dependent oxidoreductase
MKIIVIGGGIGGLTAAIALSRAGIDVEVYERAAALREVGAGIAFGGDAVRSQTAGSAANGGNREAA